MQKAFRRGQLGITVRSILGADATSSLKDEVNQMLGAKKGNRQKKKRRKGGGGSIVPRLHNCGRN